MKRCCKGVSRLTVKSSRVPGGRLGARNLDQAARDALSGIRPPEGVSLRAWNQHTRRLLAQSLPGEIERLRESHGWPDDHVVGDFCVLETIWFGDDGEKRSRARIFALCGDILKCVLLDPWKGDPVGSLVDVPPHSALKLWQHEVDTNKSKLRAQKKDPATAMLKGLSRRQGVYVIPGDGAREAARCLREILAVIRPVVERFGLDAPSVCPGGYGFGPAFAGLFEMEHERRVGECGPTGLISLTVRHPGTVELLPRSVLLEAALHELAHLRQNGHDEGFWRMFHLIKAHAIEEGILSPVEGLSRDRSRENPDMFDFGGDPRHRKI